MQPTLVGKIVELKPLQPGHSQGLLRAAADGELWNLTATVVPGPATIDDYVASALAGGRAGTVMPYTIILRGTGAICGSTRFWKIDRMNRKLEIGHTWLSASVQRSGSIPRRSTFSWPMPSRSWRVCGCSSPPTS